MLPYLHYHFRGILEIHQNNHIHHDICITLPVCQNTAIISRCLQFYHYMQGRDSWTGYLKVYVKNPGVNIVDISPVWMESGPKGDRWIMSRIPLNFGGQYHVRNGITKLYFGFGCCAKANSNRSLRAGIR